MQKIDRLGWAAGVCFHSYGLKIGVRVNQPAMPDQVLACLPPGWRPAQSPFVDHLFSLRLGGAERGPAGRSVRQFHLLYMGLTQLARTMDLDLIYEALEGAIQLLVAEHAKERVFVHAGVVAWHGRGIVLPGRSFSGKSTLTAALLWAGATYYSDEYAVLDRHGYVYPYPRRLSLREGPPSLVLAPSSQSSQSSAFAQLSGEESTGRSGGKAAARRRARGEEKAPAANRVRRCLPEELGSRVGHERLPVGVIAFAKYRRGSRWQPRPLTPGQALLELLFNTIPAQSRPEQVMTTLQQVAPRARNLKGVRGEADETAHELLKEIES